MNKLLSKYLGTFYVAVFNDKRTIKFKKPKIKATGSHE